MAESSSPAPPPSALHTDERIAALEAQLAAERTALAAERAALAAVTLERDTLRLAYRNLQHELELIRRRIFMAKAERIDTKQLELEFASKLAALDALGGKLDEPVTEADVANTAPPGEREPRRRARTSRRQPHGRRDLSALDLPEDRVELTDPALEARGKRIGWEQSFRLAWRRAGFVRLVIARAKYRVEDDAAEVIAPASSVADERDGAPSSSVATTTLPPQVQPRSLATPSLLAHLISEKFCDGLPFHRQEDRFARLGLTLDRGMMCRWAEDLGGLVGATVVAAMRKEALATAFCIATDATGVLVQPIADGGQTRRACRRGHFLVQIADADHVFFEYLPRETSAAIGELFRGFSGYVQADAKSVFDLLYRPAAARPSPDDGEPDHGERLECACYAHLRRKFWEAAITTKDVVAREALARLARIFELDRSWHDHPPSAIKRLREQHLRPHVDDFFVWTAAHYERVKAERGMLRSALGYAVRQQGALTRFFDDGRLQLTNNASERELRRVAVGRKAWLFLGSDDHAQAAGNLLTLVASARLHRLDPEAYLRDLFRVLPHWPRDRYLELAPRYWLATRGRLVARELEAELGPLTVPATNLLPTSAEQPPPS